MKKNALYALMTVLLMLSSIAFAMEANVVIELPPLQSSINPVPTTTPYYGADTLIGYYWDGEGGFTDYQSPSLLAEEQQRAEVLLLQYENGARTSQSLLNITEDVVVGVYSLDPEEYDGERVYVLLPGISLTDDQLLGIIDAYAQLGLVFQTDGLNYRNCARGGGINSTRFLVSDETERKVLLEKLYKRQELRADVPLSLLPEDDGTGIVTVDSNSYAGLEKFLFFPYRQMSDDEILAYLAFQIDDKIASTSYAFYEQQARNELRRLVNAPLTLVLKNEFMSVGNRQNAVLDDSPVYTASFDVLLAEFQFSSYYIMLDAETGICKWLYTERTGTDVVFIDEGFTPPESQRTEMARSYVEGVRRDKGKITHVETSGEDELLDIGTCSTVRVFMEDDGYYDILIVHQSNQIIQVEYVYQPTDIYANEK